MDSFLAEKAKAVFVDLPLQQPTTLYPHSIWHHDLICKLLRLLPDRHMVRMITEMVGNRSCTLTTGNGKQSSLQRLKNGIRQGLSLAPPL